jgi:hypothetical protein
VIALFVAPSLEKAQSFRTFIHTPVLPQLSKKGKNNDARGRDIHPWRAAKPPDKKRRSNKPLID